MCFPTVVNRFGPGFTDTYRYHRHVCTLHTTKDHTALWSDSRTEFTPMYNGVVRALLTPDDYNQQLFRGNHPSGCICIYIYNIVYIYVYIHIDVRCFTLRLSDASRHVTAITILFVGTYATV